MTTTAGAVPYRRTFVRLLGFLRPYKGSLIVSTILAVLSQAAAIAIVLLVGEAIDGIEEQRGTRHARLGGRGDHRRRRRQGRADGRPPAHLRPAGARDREGHARRPLRPPAAALVRLLRPPPDRPADVARDRRPADGPLLPRLRAHLLLPAHPHDRLGDGRALRDRVAAGADRARDHARRSSPSPTATATSPTPCCATCSRSSATSRRSPRSRSSASTSSSRSRRRSAARRCSSGASGAVFDATRARDPPARDLRAAALVPAAARAGGRAARRRPHGRQRLADARRVLRLQPAARDADRPAAHASACGSGRRSGRPRPASGSSR